MPTIYAPHAFDVVIKDGLQPFKVKAGQNDVPQEVAEHWYTKAVLGDADKTDAELEADAKAAGRGGNSTISTTATCRA